MATLKVKTPCGSKPSATCCSRTKLCIKQTRTNQQHQRERDFNDHQQAARAVGVDAGGRAPRALSERLGQIRPGDDQRRRKPERDAGRQ